VLNWPTPSEMQVMQDMLMDVLRALATPNLDIRQKTLDLALDLITHRNIDEVRMIPVLCAMPHTVCLCRVAGTK
jgi:coatomer subunit beta